MGDIQYGANRFYLRFIQKMIVSCFLGFVLLSLCYPVYSIAAEEEQSPSHRLTDRATNQLSDLEIDSISTYWEQLREDYGGYFPDSTIPSFKQMIYPSGDGFTLKTMLSGLLRYLWHEVLYNGKLLVTIVFLTVFSMILQNLQTAFENNTVSTVAYTITFMVLLIIAVNSFYVAIDYAKEAIQSMIHFMLAMVPLLLTLLASMGSIVTVSMMHPLIILMIHVVGTAVYTIVFPLLFFSAVLHITSALSEKYKVTQLANLLRTIGIGILGGLLAIFLGVISVQGVTGAITDGVTIRTAKYVTGNFIPVVGKMFSDAADTVISASLIAKNAVGIVGVVIILFLSAFPAIKILSLALIYQVSAAVMQPLGASPIVVCLQTIGKTMIYIFAALATVSLMFFLAVTIVITAGNAAIMVR